MGYRDLGDDLPEKGCNIWSFLWCNRMVPKSSVLGERWNEWLKGTSFPAIYGDEKYKFS